MNTELESRTNTKSGFGDLRAILQYVPLFQQQTFVVAVDGVLMVPESLSPLLLDLAVLQSLNIRVVFVHGASHQIRSLAGERGVAISNADGTGLTDDATLEVSIDAINRLTGKLMPALTAVGVRAATANALIAHPVGIVEGVDQLYTGSVARVDTESLLTFLDDGILPVVPPIGYDRRGSTLRLNSDAAAVEIAMALNADKVIYLTQGGFHDGDPALRHLSSADAAVLLASADAGVEMSDSHRSKLRHALRACREGVLRVHLVDGLRNEALLAELFSNEGVGTMVYADAYQEIRSADPEDTAAIHEMIRSAVDDSRLVPRTEGEVLRRIKDFHVVEVDGHIVACVACHFHETERMSELACLFVRRNHENQGYGRKLTLHAIEQARRQGADRIFLLTTGAREFFQSQGGFIPADPSILPSSRLRKWKESGRGSIIMNRELNDA